jgi:hypothetical protein
VAALLRNGVTQDYHRVEALKRAGGTQLTTRSWFPDAAPDNGGVGLFSTLEIVEAIEISLYLLGVSERTGLSGHPSATPPRPDAQPGARPRGRAPSGRARIAHRATAARAVSP